MRELVKGGIYEDAVVTNAYLIFLYKEKNNRTWFFEIRTTKQIISNTYINQLIQERYIMENRDFLDTDTFSIGDNNIGGYLGKIENNTYTILLKQLHQWFDLEDEG